MEMFLASIAFYTSFPISEFSSFEIGLGIERSKNSKRRSVKAPSNNSKSSPREYQSSDDDILNLHRLQYSNKSENSSIGDELASNISSNNSAIGSHGQLLKVETDEDDHIIFPSVNRKLQLKDKAQSMPISS